MWKRNELLECIHIAKKYNAKVLVEYKNSLSDTVLVVRTPDEAMEFMSEDINILNVAIT